MSDGLVALEAVQVIARSRREEPLSDAELRDLRAMLTRPEMTLLAARDEHGTALAVVAAIIDESVCLIEWTTSNRREARWALHDHLLELLIGRDVEYLLARGEGPFGALGFSMNVQHYQHLLGYELRHVIHPRASRFMRKRRLVASFVVVAALAAIAPRAMAHSATPATLKPAAAHQAPQTSRPAYEFGAR